MSEQVRRLTAGDLASGEMHVLMRAAAGLPGIEIRRILADELPGMVVFGTGGEGHPSSMVACVVHRDCVSLEYLAVASGSRGRGIGRLLVRQATRLGSPVVAETADDAVDFYRALGFRVAQAPEDPRWPGCARYRCVLGREPVADGGEDDVMSETVRRPSPEPSSDELPQWINDLVPIAARARALLRAGAPALLVAVTLVLVIPQLVAHPAPWVAAACMALGGLLALRHGGTTAPAAGVSTIGGVTSGPRTAPGTSDAVGAGPQASAGSSTATDVGGLRPGGRTGALLVVLDLLLSVTGLAAWAGLALAGTDRALLLAATAAAVGLAVGVGLVAVMELVGRRSGAVLAALAAVALGVAAVAVYGLILAAPSWWLVVGLAVGVDAVGAIALRVAVRNDRRLPRPADAA